MGFLQATLSAIPAAASSPLALVAYCVSVVAWVIISFRVLRNKQLLKHIDKFAEGDRVRIISDEMGVPPKGITIEAWIKSKTQTNILIGLSLILATVVIILIIAVQNRENPPSGDVTLAVNGDDPSVGYVSTVNDDNSLRIEPKSEYLDKLKANEIIQDSDYINIGNPKLGIKISNNSKRQIIISEIQLKIIKSKPDNQPIFIAYPWSTGEMRISNMGWGKLKDHNLALGMNDIDKCDNAHFKATKQVPIDSVDGTISIDIDKYLPSIYKNKLKKCQMTDRKNKADKRKKGEDDFFIDGSCEDINICVFGAMNYVSNERKGNWRFIKTIPIYKKIDRTDNHAYSISTHTYKASLEINKSGYTESIPVQQKVSIRDTDNFELEINTDQSAYIELMVSVISSEFGVIASKVIHLHSLNLR